MAATPSKAATSSVPATLVGKWYNELGSSMEIYPTSSTVGQFSGWYYTGVGDAEGRYDLVGMYDVSEDGTQGTLGWVVQYKNQYLNSKSVCTWSAQYQEGEGQPIITTTWLLTHQTGLKKNWESVNIGKDKFTRIPQQ